MHSLQFPKVIYFKKNKGQMLIPEIKVDHFTSFYSMKSKDISEYIKYLFVFVKDIRLR